MNVGLIESDHVVTRNDLQLVYSVASGVREHWQVPLATSLGSVTRAKVAA
ncbi:hypothetical protein OI25_4955 [Paraburkholderia fungorum]|jgi:hypothetical protein|uniref:Uncharacterized protein n=1 Tax=Paraburkholderia fungorum TaxID=134537 RepID=A0AAU8T7W9_9BURK|nr:hypothetical protein OI25_4955 [Paraburkholderia fungorum]